MDQNPSKINQNPSKMNQNPSIMTNSIKKLIDCEFFDYLIDILIKNGSKSTDFTQKWSNLQEKRIKFSQFIH